MSVPRVLPIRVPLVTLAAQPRDLRLQKAASYQEAQVDRKVMPTLARIILEQTAAAEAPPREEDVVACDTAIEQDYKTQLY